MTAPLHVRRVVLGAVLVRAGQSLSAVLDLATLARETGLAVEEVGRVLAEFDAEGLIFATVAPSGAVAAWIRADVLGGWSAAAVVAAVGAWRGAAVEAGAIGGTVS